MNGSPRLIQEKMEEREGHSPPPVERPGPGRKWAFLVSSSYSTDDIERTIGKEAYSYCFVAKAFAPLLSRLGALSEVTRPESRLDFALWRREQQGLRTAHLSFLPLHLSYLTSRAPNVAFPSWEFPDIPSANLGNNPRNNWARIANHFSLIVCHSENARDAFLRAGVTTPIRLIPIPVPHDYFCMPLWQPGQSITLDCPCFELPETGPPNQTLADTAAQLTGLSLRARARRLYRRFIKPGLSKFLDRQLWFAARAAGLVPPRRPEEDIACKLSKTVALTGVVYTTIFNPFDPRKNWQDVLTSFLAAFAGQTEVTLVLKLVLRPEMLPRGLLEVFEFYRHSGLSHRCKVVLIWSYLSDGQMLELARATTYYLNASRAEGSCLPLQNFLAAGRPGVAPVHSGMADYFDEHIGFAVDSHPEPAPFPHDPDKRLATSWHRLVWSSLYEQLKASYQFVSDGYEEYRAMGLRARQSIQQHAGEETVWPKLSEALESVFQGDGAADSRFTT
jgi:hypothetical protein